MENQPKKNWGEGPVLTLITQGDVNGGGNTLAAYEVAPQNGNLYVRSDAGKALIHAPTALYQEAAFS